jgi:hypothetical protein
MVTTSQAPNKGDRVPVDPLILLSELGITVAWARDMGWCALWLPDERVLVLNASVSRDVLAAEISDLVTDGPSSHS